MPAMAAVLGPGEGRRFEARGSEMVFKAVGATTDGRFSLMGGILPPGGRMPPSHRHPGSTEAFLVLGGTVSFVVDGASFDVGVDGFVLVRPGEVHTFGNRGSDPARVVIVHAPALDGYFEDLARLWSGGEPPDPGAEVDLMRRHGLEPAEG